MNNIFLVIVLSIFVIMVLIGNHHILPSGNFAVPAEWIKDDRRQTAAIWGVNLGIGIVTYQYGVLFHAYFLTLVFVDEWYYCVIFGLIYGFTRSFFPSLKIFRKVILESTSYGKSRIINIFSFIILINSIILIISE